MPGWRDILNRFRAAGPPGPAAPVAVPVDRRTALIEELAPVFAALRETRAEAADVIRSAREAAETVRTDADRRAARLVTDAEATRAQWRAAAFTAQRTGAQTEAAARVTGGRREADRVHRRAAERRAALVDRAVIEAQQILGPAAGSGTTNHDHRPAPTGAR
ncbi:hypothetical protein EV385_5319 [Krasilnikovia cinnamomea]|uniref:Uncharacterized protein n=1 Tax=Krasilnikovia cinnamomea TaxID=349313 RepID=A0A4V2G7Q2_9ACTN|nr:hypothetical protein [Krasilnikovia cinnamomea]RZU53396.1 hypothetical protein EV385_5319 [Krasilnikovia cinnamomea]